MEEKETKQHKQPEWCTYPGADAPVWGCWSLLRNNVKNEDFCRTCECHKHYKMYEKHFKKEFISNIEALFSEDKLDEIALKEYPIVSIVDINEDARYYFKQGLKKLKDEIIYG